MRLLCMFVLLFLCSTCLAALVNITIDDTFGDSETDTLITYLPPNAWTSGPNCTGCTAHLDATQTRNGTWHDGTSNKRGRKHHAEPLLLAFVPFHGSAIYVYCVLANTDSRPDGYTDMTFLIDSQPAGTFVRAPAGGQPFEYDVLVFANESLPHTNHNLTIQNGHVDGKKSLVLLDYIVYSHEQETTGIGSSPTSGVATAPQPTAATSSPNAPPSVAVSSNSKIIGGVLGSISIILLGLLVFLWLRQRKSNATLDSASKSTSSTLSRVPIFSTIWFPKWPWFSKPQNDSPRRFSFNPSLFVRPMLSRKRTFASRDTLVPTPTPVPITTVHPRQAYPGSVDSTHPLQPNREYTPFPTPFDLLSPATPPPNPRLEPIQPMSIREWQRRTRLNAEAMSPRIDVASVEIPSYYDFSASSEVSPDPPTPPTPRVRPRSAPRRFTVVNN